MKKKMFADGLMKAKDFTQEPEMQKTLVVGQSLQMFIAGLLFGVNSGIGSWSTSGAIAALVVVAMWAFQINMTMRAFSRIQKQRYEDGFDDALEFAKGQ